MWRSSPVYRNKECHITPAVNLHARHLYQAASRRPVNAQAAPTEDDQALVHLRQVVRKGGHLVIMAIDNNLWQQIVVPTQRERKFKHNSIYFMSVKYLKVLI